MNTCRTCDGAGEVTVCANDGSHGCSHVHDRTFPCRDCDGTGQVELFECRGLSYCHSLIEWRGLCPSCAALASDMKADAESEMRS